MRHRLPRPAGRFVWLFALAQATVGLAQPASQAVATPATEKPVLGLPLPLRAMEPRPVSSGDRLRILTGARKWRDGVVDSITAEHIHLQKTALLPALWLDRKAVDRMYRRGPRETTLFGVVTGGVTGAILGLVVGAVAARSQVCSTCGIDPGAFTAFLISFAGGTAAGAIIGAMPRYQWEEIPAVTERAGDPVVTHPNGRSTE